MYILPSGRLALCAQDLDGNHSLGDASDGLEAIFTSRRTERIREQHRRAAPAAASPICSRCNSWATL